MNMLDLILYFHRFISFLPVIILFNLYFSKTFYRLYFSQTKNNGNKVLFCFVPPTRPSIQAVLVLSCFVSLHIWSGSWDVFLVYQLVFICGYKFIFKLTPSEKKQITKSRNLTLGYGAALWYYRNYLDRFLEDNLSMRVKHFKSSQVVELPEKLYILCPRTCRVEKYIDNTPYIDRCRELHPMIHDNSGIVGREYNITVYRIEHPLQTFRCAIEYAQPLKSLLKFKEIGRITSSDLCEQREEFCKHLNQFLKDGGNANKLCELVEFDDEVDSIHDVLFKLDSIQQFIKETKLK